MKTYEIVKDYRDNDILRASFNELAKKTFGLDFEDWYQNGYWMDNYNPHSIVIDGKVVANVSVNKTDFEWNGEVKHYIQLGTVMTDENYRNRGLIRMIMNEIDTCYADKVDGMYLFANDEVIDFYPKFGFTVAKQYEYIKQVQNHAEATFKKVDMKEKTQWDMLEAFIKKGYRQSAFEICNNSELVMFYVTKFMQDCVYYCEESKTYVIAEKEADELILNMVIAEKEQDLNSLVECFDEEICSVTLGFTPKNKDGFMARELKQDDTTMYIKGNGWKEFEEAKMMIPLLAHA